MEGGTPEDQQQWTLDAEIELEDPSCSNDEHETVISLARQATEDTMSYSHLIHRVVVQRTVTTTSIERETVIKMERESDRDYEL